MSVQAGASDRSDDLVRQPLFSPLPARETQSWRIGLLTLWCTLVGWMAFHHVPWRDEGRALAFALSGENWAQMLRTLHGEGHPALWYLLLRGAYDLLGVRKVLPLLGLLIGTVAAALLCLKAPFRIVPLALMMFSGFLVFEYTVVARNYGLSALVLFVIAAWYRRVSDTVWFGALLLLLCNTTVPGVFLAGALYLYRGLELWTDRHSFRSPEWRRYALNGLLMGVGALLCFATVYPPFNDAALNKNQHQLTIGSLVEALFSTTSSFTKIGFPVDNGLGLAMVAGSLLMFASRPKALLSAVAAFLVMRFFFFFVYPAYYRHSALFFVLLIALAWIAAGDGRPVGGKRKWTDQAAFAGSWVFICLLLAQTLGVLGNPVRATLRGIPMSRAADLAQLLEREKLTKASVLVDPDSMGESLYYQTGRSFWLLRQERWSTFSVFSKKGNKLLTLDAILQQADKLHRTTGQPSVIVLALPIKRAPAGTYDVMIRDYTVIDPASVARFTARTRQLASLRPANTNEGYEVYLYPR